MTEQTKNWEELIGGFAFPRWNELPEIDLYMDQVVSYLSQKLAVFFDDEDGDEDSRGITATMINNYVKQKIIPGPQKKRYDKSSLSALFMVFCFKQILSIGQSADLIAVNRRDHTPEEAHNRFCEVFEAYLHSTVRNETIPADGAKADDDLVMTAAAIAFSNKIYAEKLIAKAKAAALAETAAKEAAEKEAAAEKKTKEKS